MQYKDLEMEKKYKKEDNLEIDFLPITYVRQQFCSFLNITVGSGSTWIAPVIVLFR